MKKSFFGLFGAATILLAGFAFAVESAPEYVGNVLTREQINSVLDLLRSYNAPLGVINKVEMVLAGTQPPPPQEWCHTFYGNFGVGVANKDVSALKSVLATEGVSSSDAGSSLQDKGRDPYFDESTASAVVAFQEKYKSEILAPLGLSRGTGYVGAGTRRKLNQLYGCDPGPGPLPRECPLIARVCSDSSSPIIGLGCKQTCPEDVVSCTADAQLCPDGSYVSRVAPRCQFAPCPQTDAKSSIKVTSPNLPIETVQIGKIQTIQWSAMNAPANAFVRISIVGKAYHELFSKIENDGSENWLVAPPVEPGRYWMSVSLCTADQGCFVNDFSDHQFEVVAPSTQTGSPGSPY